MRSILLLLAAFGCLVAQAETRLPKVLFFSNPMSSDNDVIRRPHPDVLSVAERQFAEITRDVYEVTLTQDGSGITPENLARYQAVVFFTAINPPGVDKDGLIQWVNGGGAFVGIHSTANTYQNHAAFGEMLGANYDRRPWRTREHPQTRVRIRVEDATHPSTRLLEKSFELADDIYQFKNFDRSKVQLLLSLDPESLDLENPRVNKADKDFPVSWAKPHGQGRVFYTMLGDWEETWRDPRFRIHLVEGIRWAMRLETANQPTQ
jgi:uncharacterized protein